MPKLDICFHKPRIDTYQIAIDALTVEYENPDLKYENHIEIRFMLQKLRREQKRFAEKFGLNSD
jgi:hypothetical protein